ncbi:MAG: hypothetical protein K1X88_29885 [Nannocystaceae bacterium]|nr:hypothetical protein [Nannocystaceae bacterium]
MTAHRPRATLLLCFASLLFAAACDVSPAGGGGDDDDDGGGGGGNVEQLVAEVIEISNDNVEIVCDCWDEAGFASRGACLEDQILPSQRRCVEDAYGREPEASSLYLDCITPLLRELGTCLDERLSCDAPDGTDACFADYDLGRESCVELPRSVDRALEDCGLGSSSSGTSGGTSDGSGGTSDPPPPPPAPEGCAWTDDGACDEPEGSGLCPEGSDVDDCSNPPPPPPPSAPGSGG